MLSEDSGYSFWFANSRRTKFGGTPKWTTSVKVEDPHGLGIPVAWCNETIATLRDAMSFTCPSFACPLW